MVGKGETDKEGAEQQVSAVTAVSPDEKEEDDERDEECLEGVDLGDHSLAPEGPGEPEGQCPGRRCDGSPSKPQSREVHDEHSRDAVDGGGEVHAVGWVPERQIGEEVCQHHVGGVAGRMADSEHRDLGLQHRGVERVRSTVTQDRRRQRPRVQDGGDGGDRRAAEGYARPLDSLRLGDRLTPERCSWRGSDEGVGSWRSRGPGRY